ncbi:arginyl-tRNA synthetase [unidentified eubacterium SCB49]|nr:arginyl-tRNA synthetase [unidentified eubacterium SCB49]
MKILKIILLIVGITLIGFGVYAAIVPDEVKDLNAIEATKNSGIANQIIGMIGLGVIALLAGAFLGRRK